MIQPKATRKAALLRGLHSKIFPTLGFVRSAVWARKILNRITNRYPRAGYLMMPDRLYVRMSLFQAGPAWRNCPEFLAIQKKIGSQE